MADSLVRVSNLGYRDDHDGSKSLGSPSLDRIVQITTQDGQGLSMLGEDLSTRFQIARAEECVSSDQCIYGGVQRLADTQTAWDMDEIVSEIPGQLEANVYVLANPIDKSGHESRHTVAKGLGRRKVDRLWLVDWKAGGCHSLQNYGLVLELVALLAMPNAGDAQSPTAGAGISLNVTLSADRSQRDLFWSYGALSITFFFCLRQPSQPRPDGTPGILAYPAGWSIARRECSQYGYLTTQVIYTA